ISAVGVLDTVSSLGVPLFNPGGAPVFDFSIIDTNLSPAVQNGFHALAADESRDLFSPTFWAERAGVVQQIFPGCHSDVGGGFPHRGLSDGALAWMLTQFASVGLTLNPPLAANPLDFAEDDGATFPFVFTPRSARAFPDSAKASTTLVARYGQPTEMIPAVAPTPYKPVGAYADGRRLYP
ncbi:MAG TPA: DUF2235 domain-containing protein, partial [Caulobacteraceae bacterium]|nr:DUF2235 domain-containing protein [Caulobacteraceae bacterium]